MEIFAKLDYLELTYSLKKPKDFEPLFGDYSTKLSTKYIEEICKEYEKSDFKSADCLLSSPSIFLPPRSSQTQGEMIN